MKMEVKRITSEPILLAGKSFYGDPFSTKRGWDIDNEIGRTWQRFFEYYHKHPERPYSKGEYNFYEVHIYSEETEETGVFEVFIGEASKTAEIPFELSSKYLPQTEYIEVTLHGDEITSDWWTQVKNKDLKEMGYEPSHSYLIQCADERFKGMDKLNESTLVAMVPIKKV